MFVLWFFFFFKQKTAYEMRISDWSSDVCSSDLFTFMNRATDGFTLRRWRDRAPKYHSTVPRSTRLREYPPSEKRICLTAPDSARYPWDHSRQQNQIG